MIHWKRWYKKGDLVVKDTPHHMDRITDGKVYVVQKDMSDLGANAFFIIDDSNEVRVHNSNGFKPYETQNT